MVVQRRTTSGVQEDNHQGYRKIIIRGTGHSVYRVTRRTSITLYAVFGCRRPRKRDLSAYVTVHVHVHVHVISDLRSYIEPIEPIEPIDPEDYRSNRSKAALLELKRHMVFPRIKHRWSSNWTSSRTSMLINENSCWGGLRPPQTPPKRLRRISFAAGYVWYLIINEQHGSYRAENMCIRSEMMQGIIWRGPKTHSSSK